ncbi:hypothetical protein KH5_19340 [Urechidicola sp. KH5]
MHYITPFFVALGATCLGLLPPGMLNMTAMKIALEKGRGEAKKFAFGAATIIFFQGIIALFFAKQFHENPKLIEGIEIIAGTGLFILAVFFFIKARLKYKSSGKKRISGQYYFQGVLMSSMNMLKIPYYLAITTYLGAKGHMILEKPYAIIFAFGGGTGALLLFFSYIRFAPIIEQRAQFIARNINYILTILFVILSAIAFGKAY